MSTNGGNDTLAIPPQAPSAPHALTLGYGRSHRSYRRMALVITLAAAGVAAAVAAWRALPRVTARLNANSQQSALLSFARPAEMAVWEEDPARVAALVGRRLVNGRYRMRRIPHEGGGAGFSATFLADPPREQFDAEVGGPLGEFTAFAHERHAAGGRRRLVMVTVATWMTRATPLNLSSGPCVVLDSGRNIQLGIVVMEPGSMFRPARVLSRRVVAVQLHPQDRFRLYAGQPDSSDASRFTIDYECNGVRGTLDGVFGPDDAVTIGPDATPISDVLLPAGTRRGTPDAEE